MKKTNQTMDYVMTADQTRMMSKKEKIALVILSGIAVIGFIIYPVEVSKRLASSLIKIVNSNLITYVAIAIIIIFSIKLTLKEKKNDTN